MSNSTPQTPQPPAPNRGVNLTWEHDGRVSVDWFAGTYASDAMIGVYPDMTAIYAALETQEGYLVKPSHRNGYAGSRAGGVFWGMRFDGSFREMSGRAAQAYAFSDDPAIEQISCTRLDIAYTWRTLDYDPDIAKGIYLAGPQAPDKGGRPRKRTFYENSDGGSTAYIGSPASEVRMRIYDKFAERGWDDEYRNQWRCELQLRGETARRVWIEYHNSTHRAGYLLDIVTGQCERERILDGHIIGGDAVSLPSPEANNTRIQERLQWLQTQVAPTVRELCKMGYAEEIEDIFQLHKWL